MNQLHPSSKTFTGSLETPASPDTRKQIRQLQQENQVLLTQLERISRSCKDQTLPQTAKGIAPLPRQFLLNPVSNLRGHTGKIFATIWSRDSHYILTAAQDGFLILWDAHRGWKLNAIRMSSSWGLCADLSPCKKLAAVGGLDNQCTIYALGKGRYADYEDPASTPRAVLRGCRLYISACRFLGNDNVVTASGDMTCRLWDLRSSRSVASFNEHVGDVLALDVKPGVGNASDGSIFATGCCDGYIRVWDVRIRRPTHKFALQADPEATGDAEDPRTDPNVVKFFPNGDAVAAGCENSTVRLFDLRADCEIANYQLPASLRKPDALAIPPYTMSPTTGLNPTGVLARSEPSLLCEKAVDRPPSQAYSALSSQLLLSSDIGSVNSMSFSKSGRLLFVNYKEIGTLVWDTLKNEVAGRLKDAQEASGVVSCSPDGIAVSSTYRDTDLRIFTAPAGSVG